MQIVEGNVPIKVAADILGISIDSVKGLLISGTDFGYAWKNGENNNRYQYHISPEKLARYEGYTKQEILEYMAEKTEKKK